MEKVIAIVDGFNAGRFFAPKINQRGIKCIHISSVNMRTKTHDKSNYVACFTEQKHVEQLISEITKLYQLEAVIAGSESGVFLAHEIAKQLNLRRNKDNLIAATRDKYLIQQVIKANKIPSARSLKSNNLQLIISWVKDNAKYPVVVKPVDSGGSDNVSICNNLTEVEKAYYSIIDKKNIYGIISKDILIQEYLQGDEYVVNLVSFAGKHALLEIRKYYRQKLNGKQIYDYETLLDFSGNLQQVLSNYAKQVADAVGIIYGPTHIEIMMTDDGPKLIEIAARISGATNPSISNEALGYNVIDLTIDSYLGKSTNITNKIRKYEIIIDIATNKTGKIIKIPFKDFVTTVDSVKSAYFKVDVGDNITPTVSLPSSPVKIHMLHEDKNKLLADKDMIKKVAENGFVTS